MSSNLDLTGVPELIQRLRALETGMPQALGAALVQIAQRVMMQGEALTPVRNHGVGGTLRDSGMVLPVEQVGQELRVTFGFGGAAAQYAASVHANVRSGHTGGVSPSGHKYQSWAETGQWHYLSEPVTLAQVTLVSDLAVTVVHVLSQAKP